MEQSSPTQPCTTPFPYYELHQVAHNTGEMAATPSAMDILCEIVNGEYSETGYPMPSPVPGISCHAPSNSQQIGKESFLDILYTSGSKAMEIVGHDLEMIHERHPLYNISFTPTPTTSNSLASHAFSSPDLHHFKLPLLEQEPETSVTNSQIDKKLTHKEIRRNLESSLLMHQAAGPGQLASSGTVPCSKAELKQQGEIKLHAMSSCSSPMRLYDACEPAEYSGAMVDKVQSSTTSLKPDDDDEDQDNITIECDAKFDKARSTVSPTLNNDSAKVSTSKRKATSASSVRCVENASHKKSNVTVTTARIKHGTQTSCEKNHNSRNSGNGREEPLVKLGSADAVEEEGQQARAKRVQLERSMLRVEKPLAETGGPKMPHVQHALGKLALGAQGTPVSHVDGPSSAGGSEESGKGVGGSAQTGPTRMTHISVERNRRKQMNEHLAILRSLMPASYVQRSDQASIIGGVVEFIKELQQLLTSLETQKRRRTYVAEALSPRVSTGSAPGPSPRGGSSQLSPHSARQELVATSRSALADVEVKLAGGAHVLLRTLSHKVTRGQLLHLIAALECMSLQILHLNITTLQQSVLYTFTLQIGIECRLSVDDLADVGQQIFKDIHGRRL